MNAKKLNRYLLIAFVLGLTLAGWMVRYASKSFVASNDQLQSARQEVSNLETKRDDLLAAKTILNDKIFDVESLSKALPTDKDQARVLKELYAISEVANVTIESVEFPASTLGSQTVAKPSASTSTNDKSSTTQQKVISQATPVKDIPGVQSIQVSLGAISSRSLGGGQNGVRYPEMISFIKQLEHNIRTIQIRSIDISPVGAINGEPLYSINLTLNIFVRA